MEPIVRGNGVTISPDLQTHAEERLNRLARLVKAVDSARVELRHQATKSGPDSITAQITIRSGGTILRAEERDHDARTAIDKAAAKLDQQVRKVHSKRARRTGDGTASIRGSDVLAPAIPVDPASDLLSDGSPEPAVVRVKSFHTKPMDVDEAIEHLELLGHDFYVFRNRDHRDTMSVVYRRRDGGYGLMIAEDA
ncbi:MAG: ribosome hibernation-promoting factor, HPF/YfiA family [Chloroflexota bacterium]